MVAGTLRSKHQYAVIRRHLWGLTQVIAGIGNKGFQVYVIFENKNVVGVVAGEFSGTEYYLASFECNCIHSLPQTPSAWQGSILGINSFSQKTFKVRSTLNDNSNWSKRLTSIWFNFKDNCLGELFDS